MKHRHIETNEWTRTAIDSALEYGDLRDWRELFQAAKNDRRIAEQILFVAEAHYIEGSSVLARELVYEMWPELSRGEA